MPIKCSQGQSALTTEAKQRGLGYAFKVNATVFRTFSQWARYFHFDLNAGSGFNEEVGCIGSPVTFVETMRSAGIPRYHASFCDIERANVEALMRRPELTDMCFVHHGDNRELALMIPGIIRHYNENPKFAIGSILSDPNGAQVPVDELSYVSRECPRLDLVIHWNSTINKRLRNGIKPEERSLNEVIDALEKSHWLIREPCGIHQFTLLVGRNSRFGDYKAIGFHHLESEKGKDILMRCNLTSAQYAAKAGQGELFL